MALGIKLHHGAQVNGIKPIGRTRNRTDIWQETTYSRQGIVFDNSIFANVSVEKIVAKDRSGRTESIHPHFTIQEPSAYESGGRASIRYGRNHEIPLFVGINNVELGIRFPDGQTQSHKLKMEIIVEPDLSIQELMARMFPSKDEPRRELVIPLVPAFAGGSRERI